MNLITDTWRQLVRRRLWPVALLLVAAAAALPFLLGKSPEAPPAPVAPANAAAATADAAETQPVVALVDDRQAPAKRRRVLGAQKDPFEPRALPEAKKHKHKTAKPQSAVTPAPESTPAPTTGGGGGDVASFPVAPVATPTPAPKKTYPANSLKVRFGTTAGAMQTSTLERLKVLPAGSPVLVYSGLEDDGKTAVFMVTGDVTLEGDGACEPTPESCDTLKLKAGDTEFITVNHSGKTPAPQYEIDLVTIHAKRSG